MAWEAPGLDSWGLSHFVDVSARQSAQWVVSLLMHPRDLGTGNRRAVGKQRGKQTVLKSQGTEETGSNPQVRINRLQPASPSIETNWLALSFGLHDPCQWIPG